MAFYARTNGLDEPKQKRVYILAIRFENGMECIKIGVSSGPSSLDRMLQIQRDYFNKNRTTFLCRIIRDRPTDNAYKIESTLHRFFKEYQYTPQTRFDGSTELFVCYKQAAIESLEYLLDNGIDALDEYEYDPEVYRDNEPLDCLPF